MQDSLGALSAFSALFQPFCTAAKTRMASCAKREEIEMAVDRHELWGNLGMDLETHDVLCSVLPQAFGDVYLSQENRPEGMVPPEGSQGGTVPDGQFQKPQRDPQQGGNPPEGMTPPDGFQGGQRPDGFGFGGMGGQAAAPENSIFYMQDKVNFFSGVSDL